MPTIKLNRSETFDPAESEIQVSFTYSPGSAGCGPSFNSPGDPAEDPEINITKIETEYGNDILSQISEDELDGIKLYLHETYEDTSADDLADYRYEMSREEMN